MNKSDYSVAIIGGGLAGLSLAIQCAAHHISVVLIEKESYPYHKVCGEYISLESKAFLCTLGIPIDQMQLPVINSLCISNNKGQPYRFKLPLGGFGISRYTLDNRLYQTALQKGAEIVTNTKVNDVIYNNNEDNFKIVTAEKEFYAKVAVGAYGKRSNLDLKFNRSFAQNKAHKLNNYIGVKYHIEYEHNESEIAIHNFENGYCGMSKIEDNKSCLCYLTSLENLKLCNNSIDELEKKILSANPQLQHILQHSKIIFSAPKVIAQISFLPKTQVNEHIIMIGDAAGLITPICGNGMSIALHTSKIVFNLLQLYIANKINRAELESSYISHWSKHFKLRLMIGRLVQKIINQKFISDVFLKTLSKSEWLAKTIIGLTHGKPF